MKLMELGISYLTVVIYLIVHLLCLKKCARWELNINIKNLLIICVAAILIMINNLYNFNLIKGFASFTILMVACLLVYKKSVFKTLFYSLVISIISIAIEVLASYGVSFWFSNIEEINHSFIAKSCVTVIFDCLLYFFFCGTKFFKDLYNVKLKNNKKILLISFLFMMCILSIFSFYYIQDYSNLLLYTLILLIAIVFNILFFLIIKKDFEQEKLLIQYNFLQDNIENYETMISEYQDLKHNLNNDMLTIRSVVDEPAQKLIDEKLVKYNNGTGLITNIGQIPKGLQGLIFLKISNLKQQGISVEISTKEQDAFEILDIKNYSILCDLFGIILDNAIEAAKKSAEKVIYIDLSYENNELCIKTINTFMDYMDLDLIGEENYSTKKVKSGRGLHYINKVTKKTNFDVKKEVVNNLFITSISFPLNNY